MVFNRLMGMLLCFIVIVLSAGSACCETMQGEGATVASGDGTIPISVLILPKFEVGEMRDDFPGEAQYYFERYFEDAVSYEIPGGTKGSRLYVQNGVALYVLGMGKVNAALSTMAVLSDRRFDFSKAYILSTGCAGSATEASVMGDVFVITAAIDYDLGHHADIREMTDKNDVTWFHDPDFDDAAIVKLNPELTESVWALTKEIPVETTEVTRNYMRAAFPGAEWAIRDPKVQRGTTVTADNYWKGQYDHANALQMVHVYGCPDPYATTEMEDVAVCHAAARMGMLDRLIILRSSVNMDVFMLGATPESLWNPDAAAMQLASESSVESADIFATAMKNTYLAGSAIIDAILNGSLCR